MGPRLRNLRIRAGNSLVSRAIILAYHRVCPPSPVDPFGLQVSPEHFREHLQVLRDRYSVLTLGDFVSCLDKNQLPRRSVAVTFDDGYVDNLTFARPLLREFDTPATVFVTSGFIGKAAFWWDRLLQIVMTAPDLPSEIELPISRRSWIPPSTDERARRLGCYHSLWDDIRCSRLETKERLIDELQRSIPGRSENQDARPLTQSELEQLVSGGPFSLGAHSVTHPVLAGLRLDDQVREMSESRRCLEQMTGKEVVDFSYPHGTASDIGSSSVAAARAAGFRSACTAIRGVVEPGCDPLQLTRIRVPDIDGRAFESLLRKHFTWTSSPAHPVDDLDRSAETRPAK